MDDLWYGCLYRLWSICLLISLFLSLLPSVAVVLMVMYFYYWSSSFACMYDRYYLSTFYFPEHRFVRLFLSHISYFLLSPCLTRALPLSVLLMLVFYGLPYIALLHLIHCSWTWKSEGKKTGGHIGEFVRWRGKFWNRPARAAPLAPPLCTKWRLSLS